MVDPFRSNWKQTYGAVCKCAIGCARSPQVWEVCPARAFVLIRTGASVARHSLRFGHRRTGVAVRASTAAHATTACAHAREIRRNGLRRRIIRRDGYPEAWPRSPVSITAQRRNQAKRVDTRNADSVGAAAARRRRRGAVQSFQPPIPRPGSAVSAARRRCAEARCQRRRARSGSGDTKLETRIPRKVSMAV